MPMRSVVSTALVTLAAGRDPYWLDFWTPEPKESAREHFRTEVQTWWGVGMPAFMVYAVVLGVTGLVLPDSFPFALVVTASLLSLALTCLRCLVSLALAPDRPPSRAWQVTSGWVAELLLLVVAVAIATQVAD